MPATNALLQEGRYRINSETGHEGSDTVYDAYDTVDEINVVVKEISGKISKVSTLSQRENANNAFAETANLLTQIEHPSLLGVRGHFSELGRQYLVLESAEGDDLQTLLDNKKIPFAVTEVTLWTDQMLDGLQHLHNFKTAIVHRNIRPANIKLLPSGSVKLMGLGQSAGGESSADGPGIAYSPLEQIWQGLDAASQKVITNKYDERSERILKEDLDARSDIYSLGATLYHLITGRAPVDALERSIEIIEGGSDPLLAPNRIDPGIPPEVSDVVIKAMEIKREYRFDSAAIMRQVLKTALVRVKEREAEEAREQEEAANDIRLAEEKKQQQPPTPAAIEMQHPKATEIEKPLSRAETSRMAQPTIPAALLDDDLLGLLDGPVHVSESPAEKGPSFEIPMKEANVASVIAAAPMQKKEAVEMPTPAAAERTEAIADKNATASDETYKTDAEETGFSSDEEPDQEQVDAIVEKIFLTNGEIGEEVLENTGDEDVKTEQSTPAPKSESASEPIDAGEPILNTRTADRSEDAITVPEEHASRFGVPVMAAGAVVLIVLAIGIYMLMSSGSPAPATASTETPATAQPVKNEPPPASTFQQEEVPAAGQSEPVAETAPGSESTSTSTKSVTPPAAKTKKAAAAPAKTPPPKKAVTADDLINDN